MVVKGTKLTGGEIALVGGVEGGAEGEIEHGANREGANRVGGINT